MFRVILVDDEPWVLEGWLRVFPWGQEGFKVEATFTDATAALAYAREHAVDLVVSDIRMPGIDGLELLKACHELPSPCEVVLVSGYSDYEYIHQAIQEQAFDYCLKPVYPKEAREILGRVAARLRARSFERTAQQLHALEDKPAAQVLGCPQEQYCIGLYASRDVFASLGVKNSTVYSVAANGFFTMATGEKPSLEALLASARDLCGREGQLCLGASRIAGASQPAGLFFSQAMAAAQGEFMGSGACFAVYDDTPDPRLQAALRMLSFALALGDDISSGQVFTQLPALFQAQKLGFCHALRFYNAAAVQLPQKTSLRIRTGEELLYAYPSFEAMCEELHKAVCAHIQETRLAGKGSGSNFMQLCTYVREHYNEKLNIADLSRRFYFNVTYCSELFKERLGMTFSEYITSLRMQAAIELLKDPELSLNEVSARVGYAEYFYFSKIFKKTFKVSPTQYIKDVLDRRAGTSKEKE